MQAHSIMFQFYSNVIPFINSYPCFHGSPPSNSIQLKYTIEGVSKILVPRDKTYFPRLRLGK